MLQQQFVTGGDGVQLFVEQTGDPARPALLCLHGFNQCGLCWDALFTGALAETFHLVRVDLRGHGRSDKPEDLTQYRDGRAWAEDVQAIITALRLDRPVLLGWSYGGYVICDYLRQYGEQQLRGLAFVAATTEMNTDAARALLGPEFVALLRGLLATDAAASMAALTQLVALTTRAPLPPHEFYTALGYNAFVPPYVRRGLFTRTLFGADVLPTLRVPVLVVHGEDDRIVLPASSVLIARQVPHAEQIVYPECGHMPFAELPERFAADLAAFMRRCSIH